MGYNVDAELSYTLELGGKRKARIRLAQSEKEMTLILRAADMGVPVDQLLVAHVQDVYRLRGNDVDWALAVINEVIELLRSDYNTLVPVLEALGDVLPGLGGVPSAVGGF